MYFNLISFELRHHFRQWGFWLVLILFAYMGMLVSGQRASTLVAATSPYTISQTLLFLSTNIIFAVCVLASNNLLRDVQHKMEPLIFTTNIDKFQYLVSRYVAIIVATGLIYLAVVFAMMLQLLRLEPELVGNFSLFNYFYAYSLFVLPNIILVVSAIFATAMLTKNMLAVYVAGVAIYILYIVGSILGNSPMMANSSPLIQADRGFAALIEPFGLIAFTEQSAFWSGEQRNELLPQLSGELLFNRLLWLAVSVSLFVWSYKGFSFRHTIDHRKTQPERASTSPNIISQGYQVLAVTIDFSRFHWTIFCSRLKTEYWLVIKTKTFIVLLLLTLLLTFINLSDHLRSGPISGSAPFYPTTELILALLQQTLTQLGMMVAVFYSVESFWRERSLAIDSLIEATPTNNATFYLAKLAAIMSVCMSLVAVAVLASIGFQLVNGYWQIKAHLYVIVFYHAGIVMLLTSMLTLFLQRFAVNKALGLLFGLSILIFTLLMKMSDFAHPITIFAYQPQFIFSGMADTLYHNQANHWYNLYWLSIAAIAALYSIKWWQRGSSKYKQAYRPLTVTLLSMFLLTSVGSGGYIVYQTTIVNDFLPKKQRLALMANYEKHYSHLQHMPQPTITGVNTQVDIYPDNRRYQVKGQIDFQNKTSEALSEVIVAVLRQPNMRQSVTMNNARQLDYVEQYQMYTFKFEQPLLPNQIEHMTFSLDVTHNAFSKLDGEHFVTKGGAYIELEDVLPQFGFVDKYMITNQKQRKEQGLDLQVTELPEDAAPLTADNWIEFETIVSTKDEHQVVAVGQLIRQWQADGRSYAHYKTDGKVIPQLAMTSAQFEVATDIHHGVAMKIYHHPQHDQDNQLIFDALKHTMDYFNKNYGQYQSDEFTVVELPYFASNQSFGSAQPNMYVGVENRFFNLDNRNQMTNPLLRGVSHEYAHQYWGFYVQPNYIAGYPMLTEVLCKYTELVLTEQLYGPYSTNEDVNFSIERYLTLRNYSSSIEKPLYAIGNQPMIYYSKGKYAMHALKGLIGEDKINLALKQLLQQHGYPHKPTSLDLIELFYQQADSDQRQIIDDLFKRVVFHNFAIDDAVVKQLGNGQYEIVIDIQSMKWVLNQTNNQEVAVDLNESIEIGLFSDFPQIDNSNMLQLTAVQINQKNQTITLISDEKPKFIAIDPNRYRIDRSPKNNIFKIQSFSREKRP